MIDSRSLMRAIVTVRQGDTDFGHSAAIERDGPFQGLAYPVDNICLLTTDVEYESTCRCSLKQVCGTALLAALVAVHDTVVGLQAICTEAKKKAGQRGGDMRSSGGAN